MATPGNPSYNRTAALVLGILQVLIGAANIIVQIVMYAEDLYIIGPASVGVWTGMFFLITGILAIISFKSNTNCMITSVMVMCIISALVAGIGTIIAAIFWVLSTLTGNDYRGDTAYKYKVAEDVTVAQCVLCIIYVICAIVLSAFCCQAVCCGARQEMQAGYVVTTVPGGGQQQAAFVYAAPGATYPVVQTAYPPAQASYPPAQASYPPAQASYPPAQATYPPAQPSYPAPQAAYPAAQAAYPPPQASYPPTQEDGLPAEGDQVAMYPNPGPITPQDAPPEYTEKPQAY